MHPVGPVGVGGQVEGMLDVGGIVVEGGTDDETFVELVALDDEGFVEDVGGVDDLVTEQTCGFGQQYCGQVLPLPPQPHLYEYDLLKDHTLHAQKLKRLILSHQLYFTSKLGKHQWSPLSIQSIWTSFDHEPGFEINFVFEDASNKVDTSPPICKLKEPKRLTLKRFRAEHPKLI